MQDYRHLLVALDLTPQSKMIAQRAVDIGQRYQAKISLLHVVEYVPIDVLDPSGDGLLPMTLSVEQDLADIAQQRLQALAQELGLTDSACIIGAGAIKAEILRCATEHEADLIVLGHHERHGLAMFSSGTESAVLYSAPCDLLAINLPS
jgi:universal stress protein A